MTALVAGCSFGRDGPPIDGLVEGGTETRQIPQVASVDVTAGPVWGSGRAVEAYGLPDGRTAVITTTGVYVVDEPDVPPTVVSSFSSPTQFGPSALSADGNMLALTTQNPPAVAWYDLAAASMLAQVDLDLGNQVLSVDFRSDGGLVAATATGVANWSPAGEPLPSPLAEPSSPIVSLPDGRVLTSVSETDEIAVIGDGDAQRVDLGLPDGVALEEVRASVDGSIIVGSYNIGEDAFERSTSLVVLDPTGFTPVATIELGVDLAPTNWTINAGAIVTSTDTAITAWSPTGEQVGTAPSPVEQPIDLTIAVGDGIATVHRAGAVSTWIPGAAEMTVVAPGNATIRRAHANDGVLTTTDFFGTINRLGLADGSLETIAAFGDGEATSVSHSLDGDDIAVATEAGHAYVLDRDLVERSSINAGDRRRIDAVGFQPGSDRVFTGLAQRVGEFAFDDTVALWTPGSAEPDLQIGGEGEDVAGCSFFYNRVVFSPDGELMSTTSHDFTVTLHTAATGEPLTTFPAMPSTVLATDFAPDSDMLVASADDSTVTVWDAVDFAQLASYRAVPGGFQSLATLPDRTMITSDLTGRITVVDMMTGEELRLVADTGARSPVLDVTDDGGLVAAALPTGLVGIWSTVSGVQLATLAGHAGDVVSISFAPDGRSLVTASRDGTARAWNLEIVSV